MAETDHELAHRLADEAGRLLLDLQRSASRLGWGLESAGDRSAHEFLADALATHRPGDAVLSEEGADDRSRVGQSRVWIVDPLDGSSSFGSGSPEWAVHVALVVDGEVRASAVAAPALGTTLSTRPDVVESATSARTEAVATGDRARPLVVAGRSRAWDEGRVVADAIGGDVAMCSSAGVKAVLVATGDADVYVHDAPLYEWDLCAPVGVALGLGLAAVGPDARPLRFNAPRPVVPGVIICDPAFADGVVEGLRMR